MRVLIVRCLLVVCLAGASGLLAQPFFFRKDVPVGGRPNFVVAGDFDADRRPDLAVYDWYEGTLTLLNAGGGNFGRPILAGVKVNIFRRGFLTVADVNGDGKDDLVTIEGVFLSRGDGTFQPTQQISNAKGVVVVTAGDFNGDGKSDVLISDEIAGTRVMLSNGDGTFRSGPTVTAQLMFFALVADFNRDGRSDIIGSVRRPDPLRDVIFLGNGDGTFGAGIQVGDSRPGGFFVADFNGDGLPDLAARAGILPGRGDGSFQSPVRWEKPEMFLYTAADLTGDGKADLVGEGAAANSISIYPGNGDGTLSAPFEQGVGRGDTIFDRVAAVDLDGDRRLDLVIANTFANTISLLMTKAQGGPAFRGAVSAATGTPAVAPQSLATLFAPTPATATAGASPPWPTRLGGFSLQVRDSAGTTRLAPLLFVSPTQVNFQVPGGTALGEATLAIVSDRGTSEAGSMQVEAVAPGLFLVSHNPLIPAATGILGGGPPVPVPLFSCSGTSCKLEPIPLSTAGDRPIYLSFFGTGFRGANPVNVTCSINGVRVPVLYAGPQEIPGVDQINIRLLPEVLEADPWGFGTVVTIRIEGVPANPVEISIF